MRKLILLSLTLSFPITSLNAVQEQKYESVPSEGPNAVGLEEITPENRESQTKVSSQGEEGTLTDPEKQDEVSMSKKESGRTYKFSKGSFWFPGSNDDEEAMIKRNRRRWLIGGGLTAFALLSFAGDGMSIGGSQAINRQLSPITAYPYTLNETKIQEGYTVYSALTPPDIEHKPGCTYKKYDDGYAPEDGHTYIKGDAWCGRGYGCWATIETCEGADSYISNYKVTLAGQIISLITKAPLMGTVLGVGIKFLIKP